MNRLKIILKEQRKKQSFICENLGKSKNTVSLWCRNQIQPSVNDLYKISELLKTPVKQLLVDNTAEIQQLKKEANP